MSVTRENVEAAFKDLGVIVETDGQHYLYTTEGRYAPLINSILTIDSDNTGATLTTVLSEMIPPEKKADVVELLNLVHGQSLWNVRFHLDETGRVYAIGKHLSWGKPFNTVQFGDIFFTSLVTTDRLFPCLTAITKENLTGTQAFERFFIQKSEIPS
jgi:hypothetical protein